MSAESTDRQPGTFELGRRTFLQVAAGIAGAAGVASFGAPGAAIADPILVGGQLPAPTNAAFLMDETFAFMVNFDARQLTASGWELRAVGGAVSYAFGSWFRLTDNASAPAVGLSKKFRRVSAGILVWEFRFQPLAAVDGTNWALLAADGTTAVELRVVGGNLTYTTPTGPTVLVPVAVDGRYGVRVTANLDTQTVDMDVEGQRVLAGAAFTGTVSDLDTVFIETDVNADLYVGPIRVSVGYRLLEDSYCVFSGNVPDRWVVSAAGALTVVKLNHSRHADNCALRLVATGAAATLQTSIAATTSASQFEVSFFAPTAANGLVIELVLGNGRHLRISVASSKLYFRNSSGTDTQFSYLNFTTGIWHQLRVVLNGTKADIFHNGKKKANQVTLAAAASGVSPMVQFTVPSGGTAYFDDLRISPAITYPSDYVPAPTPVATGDYILGMQSCSIWREGYHRGWDVINPYKERTPLLGYYDEGSPEVADWETKWLSENGVTFQLYCWFRPQDGKGAAIKMPRLGMHLHEGYFVSRYSDSTKFAIMWENSGGQTDSADFRKYIAPFWLEYYFKDPRYMLIDNKPVLSIYSAATLVSNFGSSTAARAEIDYLRTLVQSAGFADLILIGNGSAATAALGFDAEYSYSRKGYLGPQAVAIEARRAASTVDVLPTLSMGRNDLAWNDIAGDFSTPAAFQQLAEWARDDYMPGSATGALSTRMAMLDNWNEFGEGHFMFPSALAGFGYLEALRTVFGAGAGPANVTPTSAQVDRVTTLYPTGRELPPVNETVPAKSSVFTIEWLFDTDGDLEGWTDFHGTITSLRAEAGALRGTSTTNDPVVVSPDALGIEAADHPYIRVKMSSSVPSEQEFYFSTPSEVAFARDKGSFFCAEPVPGVTGEYDIPVWRLPKWRGTIKQIRLDPMGVAGDFSIESVKLMYVASPTPRAQLNGAVYPDLYVQPVGAVALIPADFVFKRLGIPANANSRTGTYSVLHGTSFVEATLGSTTAYLNGIPFVLDAAPQAGAYDEALLPLSFFIDGLGATGSWDGTTIVVDIP